MKRNYNILRTLAAFFAAASVFVSCGKEEPQQNGNQDNKDPQEVAPSFPKLVENNNVAPGSELTLTFTPNYDWEVSVPTEVREWFWLKDGSFTKTELKGKASATPVTVMLGVTEVQDFDKSHSCEVTMKMNSKSQVIARFMLPAKERTIEVYAAKFENGDFVRDEAGNYVYDSEQTGDFSLAWSAADADFRMPVKVVSNSEWTLDIPSWMNVQVPESTIGSVEMVFSGASLTAAEGNIVFSAGSSELKKLKVSVPSCGEVDVYVASLDANGDFAFAEDGGYLYSESPVEAVTLVWPGSDYRMPVMVDARCSWDIVLPEWLTVTYQDEEPENKAGQVKMNLMGDPKLYPLETTTGKVQFMFNEEKIHEISVTIPGVKDMFSYGIDMSLTSLEFNAAAELMTSVGYREDMPATGWFTGTKDATAVAVEMKDGKRVSENPEWLVMDVQAYVTGGDVLQTRTVSVSAKVNESEERNAYIIFCKSAYKSEDYFNADGTLKNEMASYAVALVQHGSDIDYVTMLASESEMASAGVSFIESTNPRLVTYFGQTDYVYEMTYNNQYASDSGYMSLARPYSSVKIYNAARTEQTSADFWLAFSADDTKDTGVITMYKDQTPSESKTEGYVVFYDADGTTLAIIHCKFDPVVVTETITVEFTEASAAEAKTVGATLEQLTEGELFDEYNDGMHPVFHLKYTVEGKPLKIKLPEKVFKHNVNPAGLKSNIMVNGTVYDEYFGPNDILGEVVKDADGAVEISMEMPEGHTEKMIRGNINFTDRSDGTVFVLICTLDLSK